MDILLNGLDAGQIGWDAEQEKEFNCVQGWAYLVAVNGYISDREE